MELSMLLWLREFTSLYHAVCHSKGSVMWDAQGGNSKEHIKQQRVLCAPLHGGLPVLHSMLIPLPEHFLAGLRKICKLS